VGGGAAIILLAPLLATVANLWLTMGQATDKRPTLLGYFKTSLIFYALAGVFAVFASLIPQLRLTLFGEGQEQLALYGFVGLALFGAIHYIAPRLTGVENDKFVCASGGAITIGIIIYAGAYLAGGILQQNKLVNASAPFVEIMNATKPFIRISTLGVLLIVLGNVAMLARVLLLVRAWCRTCCASCCGERTKSAKLKPAGAVR
jgi:cytochrome c oxidase cbb3-type subunit I